MQVVVLQAELRCILVHDSRSIVEPIAASPCKYTICLPEVCLVCRWLPCRLSCGQRRRTLIWSAASERCAAGPTCLLEVFMLSIIMHACVMKQRPDCCAASQSCAFGRAPASASATMDEVGQHI